MLNDNIKRLRKEKGLSQEELAEKINVVRQTVSKWENGLSVPDAEMLLKIADVLDTQISVILDADVESNNNSDLETIENEIQILKTKLEKQNITRRKIIRTIFLIILIIALIILFRYIAVFINYIDFVNNASTEAVIIGGNNTPTSIFVVNTTLRKIFPVIAIIITLISLFGIYKTRNK